MPHDVRVGVTLPLAGKQVFAIAVALQLLGCGGNPATSPSTSAPTPVPAPSPSPVPSPSPGPTPLPAPVPPLTISGLVRDGLDGNPLSSVSITQSSSSITFATDSAGRFSLTISSVPQVGSNPVVRFRRVGFLEQSTSVNQDTTLEVILPRSCTITPGGTDGQGVNHDVHVTVGANYVEATWGPLTGARDYQIEVSQLTRSDLAAALKPPTVFTQLTGGTASYRWNTPNPGDYWIRYRTKNDCGLSAPSRYEFVQVR